MDNGEKGNKKRQVFYAVHDYEIIPCHIVARKDRDHRGKYAANSKRDKRRFQTAYNTIEEARREVVKYEEYMSNPDII